MNRRVMRRIVWGALVSLLMCGAARASEPYYGEINEPDVNVRVDSTVGAQVVCVVRKGERVKIIAEAYDWFRIALPRHAPAYLHKDFVLVADGKTEGKVLKNKVNVRLRPDIGSPILGQVDKGDAVEVMRAAGDWLKIVPPPNASGWVNKNFINRLAAAPGRPDPAGDEAPATAGSAVPAASVAVSQAPQAAQEFLVVEGLLKKKVFTRAAPYKILTSEGDLYLVTGDIAVLNANRGKRVRITGIVRATYDDPPVIVADKIEPLP